MKGKELENFIFNYPTKYEQGFTKEEIDTLLTNNFPHITREKFGEVMGVVTCMIINDEIITYHSDIYHTINAIQNGRGLTPAEWD